MIPLFKVYMADSIQEEIIKTLYSGFIGEGPKVVEFEKQISEKFNLPYVLTTNNGTAALHMAYNLIADYDREAEFIVSPMTCSATLTPILGNQNRIVWADIDPVSGNIDPEDIKRKITPKTKGIIMVHWGGNPCDIKAINEIAKNNNIKTVEDGAHSLGATLDDKYIGSFSDFTMFSLQAIKHVTSVDGGLLVCKSEEDYKLGKLLRWYGIDREDNRQVTDLRCELNIPKAGWKYHMNDVCATVGIENFKHLDKILSIYRDNAQFYNDAFKDTQVGTITPIYGANPAYWLYTINVNHRDELMAKLKEEGIMSSKVHARNDTHSMFRDCKATLPGVDQFNSTHLCIPVGWWVTKDDREFIAETILKYVK